MVSCTKRGKAVLGDGKKKLASTAQEGQRRSYKKVWVKGVKNSRLYYLKKLKNIDTQRKIPYFQLNKRVKKYIKKLGISVFKLKVLLQYVHIQRECR